MNNAAVTDFIYHLSKMMAAGFGCQAVFTLMQNNVFPVWLAFPVWSTVFVIMLRSVPPLLKIIEGHHSQVETRWL